MAIKNVIQWVYYLKWQKSMIYTIKKRLGKTTITVSESTLVIEDTSYKGAITLYYGLLSVIFFGFLFYVTTPEHPTFKIIMIVYAFIFLGCAVLVDYMSSKYSLAKSVYDANERSTTKIWATGKQEAQPWQNISKVDAYISGWKYPVYKISIHFSDNRSEKISISQGDFNHRKGALNILSFLNSHLPELLTERAKEIVKKERWPSRY